MLAPVPAPDKGVLHQAALALFRRHHWSIIPVRSYWCEQSRKCVKPPAVDQLLPYQGRAADEAELHGLFLENRYHVTGLGVMLGAVSGGLAVRDFDNPAGMDAYRRWASAHPELARVLPTAETGRGYHVYFRKEPFLLPTGKRCPAGSGEYLTRGYTVLPPSWHALKPYRWLIPPGEEIPLVDPLPSGLLEGLPLPKATPSTNSPTPTPSPPLCVWYKPETPEVRKSVDNAIKRTLPTGPGQRHDSIFRLARRLKSIPGLADAQAESLKDVFSRWLDRARPFVREERWPENWRAFRTAWANAWPTGDLVKAMRRWLDEKVPLDPWGTSEAKQEQRLLRLELACEVFSEEHGGGDFPLSEEIAGTLVGVSRPSAGKLLKHLEEVGILVMTQEYDRLNDRAREWRYKGPVMGIPMTPREPAAGEEPTTSAGSGPTG